VKLEPLSNFVVLRIVKDTHTASGLHIPERMQENKQKAVVLAIGPDVRKRDDGQPIVAVDDRVFVIVHQQESRVGETDVTGEKLVICRDEDIAARVISEAGDELLVRPGELIKMPTEGAA
jgi:co-chaperonin GroES (HSP10)